MTYRYVIVSVALSHFSVPFQKVSKGQADHHRLDEDGKNQQRMESLVDQLQAKIKSYKKQIEEAEEIAALNLAKYRQVSQLLTTIDMIWHLKPPTIRMKASHNL